MKQASFETLNSCPVCSETVFSSFLTTTDHSISKEAFTIVQCASCGFKFTNPRPNTDEIGPYYESEDYISHSNTSKGVINRVYQLVRTYTIRKKTQLYARLAGNQVKSVLDYGCGTGELLKELKKQGWTTLGIEPGEKARAFATAENGLHVKKPDALSEIADKSFSIISMWHVLEHVHELHPTLKELKRILNDNGRCIVAVPNSDSYDATLYGAHWAAYDLPRHLYHFNKASVSKLFSMHKMEIEMILPMYFDSFYVSMLSEKYSTGKINYLSALINGIKSNAAGKKDNSNFSSLIFVLRKRELN
ncbi:MAG TPA: class I SAM-dependent methyltransferase [Bacteroidia bacterium]|nr:class I SAM-dependent methyltransferase [Bacteroidia bacterium]